MKRAYWLFVLSFLIVLMLPALASAQDQPPAPPGPGFAGPPDPPFGFGPQHRGMGPGMGRGMGPRAFRGQGPGMFPPQGFGRLQEELGLTEEQRNKLHQQSLEGRKASVRTRADLEIKRMELGELMRADNPDRAQIDRKLRELADLRYAREKSRVDQHLAFLGTLTPEQRTKLKQFRERGFGPGPQGPGGQGPGPMRRQRPSPPQPPQL